MFGGTQDTGSAEQSAGGNTMWNSVNLGDGNWSAVDNVSLGGHGSIRYTMENNFGSMQHASSTTPTIYVLTQPVALTGLNATDAGFTGFSIFPYELNNIAATRMIVGGNGLYESTDLGDNLTTLNTGGREQRLRHRVRRDVGGVEQRGRSVGRRGRQPAAPHDLRRRAEQPRRLPGRCAGRHRHGPGRLAPRLRHRQHRRLRHPDSGANWITIDGNIDDFTDQILSIDLFSPANTPGDRSCWSAE